MEGKYRLYWDEKNAQNRTMNTFRSLGLNTRKSETKFEVSGTLKLEFDSFEELLEYVSISRNHGQMKVDKNEGIGYKSNWVLLRRYLIARRDLPFQMFRGFYQNIIDEMDILEGRNGNEEE